MADFKPLPKPVRTQNNLGYPKKRRSSPEVTQPEKHRQVVKAAQPVIAKEPSKGKIHPYQSQQEVPKKKSSPYQRQVGRVYRFLRKKSRWIVSIGAALILAVSLISLLGWFISGTSAMALYIGEEHFGYMNYSQELDEETFRGEVISRIEARENARVQIDEPIFLRPASGSPRNVLPLNEAIEQLAATLSFQIIGTAVEVNGYRVGVLRSQNEAEEVIWRLQSPFLQGNAADYYSVDFVEDFHLVTATIDEDALSTVQQVMHRLDSRSVVVDNYTVQSGDTLGGIALRHNITLARLLEDNPDFTANSVLRIGDVMQIQSYRPFLSVRTVRVETRTVPIPIEIEALENAGEVNTFSQVIQEGVEGEQRVVVHIIRINGVQTEPEQIISTEVIRMMEKEIIEVGTMEAIVERR